MVEAAFFKVDLMPVAKMGFPKRADPEDDSVGLEATLAGLPDFGCFFLSLLKNP